MSRPTRALLALLALSPALATAQTTFVLPDTAPLGTAARAILRLEQTRSTAINAHDTLALRRIYADDFRGVTATGVPVDRARLLRVFTGDESPYVFTIDEVRVLPLGTGGDAAVYTARLVTKRRTGEVVTESRFVHAYEWRAGRWQIVAAQGTTIAP